MCLYVVKMEMSYDFVKKEEADWLPLCFWFD